MSVNDPDEPARTGSLFSACRRWLDRLDTMSKVLVILAMAVMAALVVTQVFFRYALSNSIDWAEEIARLAFVWAMFLAIPHGLRSGIHVGIDILVMRLPERLQEKMFRISAVLGAVLMGFVLYFSWQVTVDTWPELMPTVDITASVYYIAVLVAAGHSLLHLALLAWGGSATWQAEVRT